MSPAKTATRKATHKTTKSASAAGKTAKRFTAEEVGAMKARARELKAADADGESQVLEKIAAMSEPDRSMAKRVHAIIKAAAPGLTSRLWYGMPAYAKDGAVVCFFQDAKKFKSRYATLGFSDKANLDEGAMWPVAYAVKDLTARDEDRITELVQRAAS